MLIAHSPAHVQAVTPPMIAAIGHTTGTRPETRLLKMNQKPMIMPLT